MELIKILLILLVLDFLWIGLIFKNYFSPMIQHVQGSPMEVRPLPAFIAYLFLFALGAMFLPKLDSVYEAFLLGVCVYGVYDATNLATIKNWDPLIAFVDTIWGGVLFASIYWCVFGNRQSRP